MRKLSTGLNLLYLGMSIFTATTANAVSYQFSEIAGSNTGSFGSTRLSLNNNGIIAYIAVDANSKRAIYSNVLGAISPVYSASGQYSDRYFSSYLLNNNNEIVSLSEQVVGNARQGNQIIHKWSNGTITDVANDSNVGSSRVIDRLAGFNDNGTVLFSTEDTGYTFSGDDFRTASNTGIRKVYTGQNSLFEGELNNNGDYSFWSRRLISGRYEGTIWKGNVNGSAAQIAAPDSIFSSFGLFPGIAEDGTVYYSASYVNGGKALLAYDGISSAVVADDSGIFKFFSGVHQNLDGTVSMNVGLDDGSRCVFVGGQESLCTGDFINGKELTGYQLTSSGFNDFGEYVFGARFADGSSSILYASAVPVPAAVWLFGSGLIGLVGFAKKRGV